MEDVLDANIFPSIEKAKQIADRFRSEYNEKDHMNPSRIYPHPNSCLNWVFLGICRTENNMIKRKNTEMKQQIPKKIPAVYYRETYPRFVAPLQSPLRWLTLGGHQIR
jgi:hypothetical protein